MPGSDRKIFLPVPVVTVSDEGITVAPLRVRPWPIITRDPAKVHSSSERRDGEGEENRLTEEARSKKDACCRKIPKMKKDRQADSGIPCPPRRVYILCLGQSTCHPVGQRHGTWRRRWHVGRKIQKHHATLDFCQGCREVFTMVFTGNLTALSKLWENRP